MSITHHGCWQKVFHSHQGNAWVKNIAMITHASSAVYKLGRRATYNLTLRLQRYCCRFEKRFLQPNLCEDIDVSKGSGALHENVKHALAFSWPPRLHQYSANRVRARVVLVSE
jgi:hypothetical protein